MKIGHLIRAERVRQDMKQIVLAKGICTPSYLSKIERNQIEPSEDITEMLMKRLGMDPGKLQENDEEMEREFEKMLLKTYREVMTARDLNFTREKLEYLELNVPLFENDSLHFTYSLITFRFNMIVRIDSEKLKQEINLLEESIDNFDVYQLYLFHLNKGLFCYNTGNVKMAIHYYELLLHKLESLPIGEWEKAEFNYIIAVFYASDGHTFNSIDHARLALNFFREHLLMSRVLDCYILIGISYKRSDKFQDALEAYSKAMQISEEFNLHSEKGIIYHNLGTLNSSMGNREQAIEYYKKSIDYKIDPSEKPITILCLIEEYSKMNEQSLVSEWADKGIALYHQLKDENEVSYFHHFSLYKSLHSKEGLSVDIAEATIQHFKDIQNFRYIHKYCISLAEWYYNNRKYKLASTFYREGNKYGYIDRKIDKWEDI
ncbi:tetratricopeptide repeat protein [Sporosarcina koreensis]|uniref:tetratricopeptide repeat protein n=1 Tax=Sporosarcina koreensis TaxID=334735 RepID=UPI00075F209E|nr:tetratricopeptide repeat protein [Sporosarcina koreensis]